MKNFGKLSTIGVKAGRNSLTLRGLTLTMHTMFPKHTWIYECPFVIAMVAP